MSNLKHMPSSSSLSPAKDGALHARPYDVITHPQGHILAPQKGAILDYYYRL